MCGARCMVTGTRTDSGGQTDKQDEQTDERFEKKSPPKNHSERRARKIRSKKGRKRRKCRMKGEGERIRGGGGERSAG